MDNILCIEEVWKPVVGYEGLYEVSNLGKVKSLPKKGFKKEVIRKTGMDVRNGYVKIIFLIQKEFILL
jgi:hypothetical protein